MLAGGLRRTSGYTRRRRQEELQRRGKRQCQCSLPTNERSRLRWERSRPVQEFNTAVAKYQAKSRQLWRGSKFEPTVPVGIDNDDEEYLADALGQVTTTQCRNARTGRLESKISEVKSQIEQ